jgi:hypothetical protein
MMEMMLVTNEAMSIGIPKKTKLNPINRPAHVKWLLYSLSRGINVKAIVKPKSSTAIPKKMKATKPMVFPFWFIFNS